MISVPNPSISSALLSNCLTSSASGTVLDQTPAFLQVILDTMPHGIYWLDDHLRFMGANRVFLDEMGLSDISPILGQVDVPLPWQALSVSCQQDNLRVLHEALELHGREEYVLKRDGTTAWHKTTKVPLRNAEQKVIGLFCCYEDITAQKRLQDAIHQIASGVSAKTGNSFFQSLAQYLGQVVGTEIVALALIDETGTARTIATLIDGQFENTFKDSLIGTPCNQVLQQGRVCCYPQGVQTLFPEDHHLVKWGAQSYLGMPLVNTNNELIGLIAVLSRSPLTNLDFAQEILQIFAVRVSAEMERQASLKKLRQLNHELEARVQLRTQALAQSLQEKEVLLKEIHHRVKNNLQIISSLLRMQSRHNQHPPAVGIAFEDAQNRIGAMALIHEQLYRSVDLSKSNFDEYLESLVMNLLQSYRLKSQKVQPIFSLESIRLNLNSAIPCGLIVNELISNALKYAFPLTFSGEAKVYVKLAETSSEKILLEIADNGVGMSPDFDWQNAPSLGLKIVSVLVEQLQGEIQLDRSRGTIFRIYLPATAML